MMNSPRRISFGGRFDSSRRFDLVDQPVSWSRYICLTRSNVAQLRRHEKSLFDE
jgi:hypothetical protein